MLNVLDYFISLDDLKVSTVWQRFIVGRGDDTFFYLSSSLKLQSRQVLHNNYAAGINKIVNYLISNSYKYQMLYYTVTIIVT